jgi:hypothetical protein
MAFCVFEQYDDRHVKCTECGRKLSGTPERYRDRIQCHANGNGEVKVGCCGKSKTSSPAQSRFGEKVMVQFASLQATIGSTKLVHVKGAVTKVNYGHKYVDKPFCLYKLYAEGGEEYQIIGPCK